MPRREQLAIGNPPEHFFVGLGAGRGAVILDYRSFLGFSGSCVILALVLSIVEPFHIFLLQTSKQYINETSFMYVFLYFTLKHMIDVIQFITSNSIIHLSRTGFVNVKIYFVKYVTV